MKIPTSLQKPWSCFKRYYFAFVAFIFVSLAFYLRFTNLDTASGDYNQFIRVWMEQIVANGGFTSLAVPIGDYSPPYMLILTIISYFPTPNSAVPYLIPIKMVSLLFDLVMAIGVFFLVSSLLKDDQERFPKATLAGTVTLFLPTVFLNSAIWGQADAIYASFIVWSLYFYSNKKHLWGALMFAIAFSFKLQSIFIVPLFVLMYLLNRPKQLWHVAVIPAIYLVFSLPALIYGRPLLDLLTIYARQTDIYRSLTLNMPNMYQWFPAGELHYALWSPFAIALFTLLMTLCFFYFLIAKRRLRMEDLVPFALWSLLMANFFLPAMHERYLYVADVLSLVFYHTKKRHVWVPLAVNFISFFAYFPFLFGMELIPLKYVAVVYAALIIAVTIVIFIPLKPGQEIEKADLA